MKALSVTFILLTLTAVVHAGERLTIKPARAYPDFTMIRLAGPEKTDRTHTSVFALGDFDEDGRVDAAIIEAPLPLVLVVYIHNLDGGVTRKSETYELPAMSARTCLAADLNEDGHLDLLLDDYGTGLVRLLGNGDGTFKAPEVLNLNALAFPTLADLNADGHLDLVAVTRESAAMVFIGSANGTLTPGVTLDTLTNPFGERRGQIMIADINRDGKLDIAVASVLDFSWSGATWTGNLDIFWGRGDGTFEEPIRNANMPTWRGALGDFNGDGILDYAGDRYNPAGVEIWLGNGNGAFKKRATYSMVGYQPYWVTAADINADGLLDIVVANSTEEEQPRPAPLAVFLGIGDGTFQARRFQRPLDGAGAGDTNTKTLDWDGDGLLDIVCPAIVDYNQPGAGTALILNRSSKLDPALGFQVTLHEADQITVVLETSLDLKTWSPLATNTPSGWWSLIHKGTSSGQRFYRTRNQ